MAFITAFVDCQFGGASIIRPRPDGTRSPMVLQVGAGLTASFTQSGDLGLVALSVASLPTIIAVTTYTDAAAHTVATIAVPASGIVIVSIVMLGNLGTNNGVPGTNAPNAPGTWVATFVAWRTASGAVSIQSLVYLSSAAPPFIHDNMTSASGLVAYVVSGNNVLVQVNGFAVTEAWTSGHTYTKGDGSSTIGQFVTASGNVYLCTTSGTASGSAPTGTGTGLGTGAKFDYVCAGSVVPVQWSGQYTTQQG